MSQDGESPEYIEEIRIKYESAHENVRKMVADILREVQMPNNGNLYVFHQLMYYNYDKDKTIENLKSLYERFPYFRSWPVWPAPIPRRYN